MSDQKQPNNLIIGSGVSVAGKFNVPGRAVVDGALQGDLVADELIVGPTGKIIGTVQVRQADIHGETHEFLTTAEHLIIRSTGKVHGKAIYGQIEVEKGGQVQGNVSPADVPSRPALEHDPASGH